MRDKLADWYHSKSRNGQAEIRERQAREWDTLTPLVRYYRYLRAEYRMNKRPFVIGLGVGAGALAIWGYLAGIPLLFFGAAIAFGIVLGIILSWEAQ